MSSVMSVLIPQISLVLSAIVKNNEPSTKFPRRLFPQSAKSSAPSIFTFTNPNFPTISAFLENIESETDCSTNLFILALCLLRKLESTKASSRLCQKTVQGVFYTCFSLGFKYLEDVIFSDPDFADIAGMDTKSHVAREIHCLHALGFNTTISSQELEEMTQKLHSIWLSRLTQKTKKTLASCTRISDLFADAVAPVTVRPPLVKFQKTPSEAIVRYREQALPKLGSAEDVLIQSGGVILVL